MTRTTLKTSMVPPFPIRTPMVDERGALTAPWAKWLLEFARRTSGDSTIDAGDSDVLDSFSDIGDTQSPVRASIEDANREQAALPDVRGRLQRIMDDLDELAVLQYTEADRGVSRLADQVKDLNTLVFGIPENRKTYKTMWDDMRIVPGSFDRPGVSDPALVSYTPTGSGLATYLYEFAKNDVASFTVQLPHSYKQGSDIFVHLHWTPGTRGNEENGNKVGWKIDYTWANIDGTFAAMGTADLSDACDGTDDKHQMTPEATLTGSGKNMSSMLICNIKRTDTGTDDTWAGTASGELPLLLEIDFHFPMDALGSKQISKK